MNIVIVSLVGLVVGFIAGALVFRKNAAKAEAAGQALADAVNAVKADAKKL